MKKILFVGAEAMPFAATGGLGDVLGSLPAALKASEGEDIDIRVVMPLYGAVGEKWRAEMTDVANFDVQLSWRRQYCGIKSLVKDGVTYYFIDNEYYFKRDKLYGHFDDAERYAFFCMAVMEMLPNVNFYPDVLHAHDWQGALSIVYLKTLYRARARYANIKTVYTIHNIEYQGIYNFYILGDVFGLGHVDHELMDYDGCINLMKAAIQCADRVTTVSQRYSEEIRTSQYAHGLEYVLNDNAYKLSGILNGIDYDYYNPQTDKAIEKNFTWRSLAKKAENKTALQRALGLPENPDVPMLSIISRLAGHKGLDLVSEIGYRLAANKNSQLVVLGMGEARFENYFRDLEKAYPDRVRALIEYDRDLSKRIYAASDIFIMPSKSEPCGLSQMIASRYGAIPVTRETGGLYDSIKPYWINEKGEMMGNGFTFADYSSSALYDRITAALELYSDKEKREALVKKIMRTDFSWKASAKKYTALYDTLC